MAEACQVRVPLTQIMHILSLVAVLQPQVPPFQRNLFVAVIKNEPMENMVALSADWNDHFVLATICHSDTKKQPEE